MRMDRFPGTAVAGIITIFFGANAAQNQPTESSIPGAPVTTAVAPVTALQPVFDVTFGTLATSDYNYRGYTLSDHKPSVSAYFEGTYGILFARLYASSVRLPNLPSLQNTYSAGIRPVFDAITVEIGVDYYNYPGSHGIIDYPEYYLRPSYVVNSKLTLGLNFYYAPNYIRSGAWENYISATAKYAITETISFSSEIGRQRFGTTEATVLALPVKLPDYSYWNIGFAYTYKIATFDLRYHATTLSKQNCFLITGTGDAASGSRNCGTAIIATMSLDSSLPALKALIAGK
jgi:uncharacterized protein (TIGR02001 family)